MSLQRIFYSSTGGGGGVVSGNGSQPNGRVVHSETTATLARRLTGLLTNMTPDGSDSDDDTKPSWFWGYSEQYDPESSSTVTGSDRFVVGYVPADRSVMYQRFSIDHDGVVYAVNLHCDSILAVGYSGVGGGQTVLAIQDATTVPSTNPTGGGVLYSEAGALKWRGSSGTVTTIAPA